MKEILKDKENFNYIKKASAFEKYSNKNINNDLIKLYFQFNHLKDIYRQGWIKNLLGKEYIDEIESIADHSWSVAMLAISVIEKYNLEYDITKCMKLSIIHELGEIYAGDFTPSDNITKDKKHELEEKAIQRVFDTINFDNDFIELWQEYENQETKESQFIRQLDKLECIMQASCYGLDISYVVSSEDNITLPCLKEILMELEKLTNDNDIPLNIKENINKELVDYIENEIFPLYQKNEEGHGIKHIKKVIKRSLKFAKKYNAKLDMAYTIAAYHDIGHYINREKHEIISAEIFMKDEKIKKWFTDEQRNIIKEAIEDHRASSNHKPRSIYGMIVSTADRTIIDIDNTIKRSYSYGKRNYKELTEEEQIERMYNYLKEKYGENGYAKIYLEDEEFDEAIEKLRQALSNKEKFIERVKKVINNTKN